MLAELAVQGAVYERLTDEVAAEDLLALVEGVFDEVPQNTALPYVQFGTSTAEPWHTFGRRGWKVSIPLFVWSEFPGNSESLTILGEVANLLDEVSAASMPVEGHDLVRMRRLRSGVSAPDPDGFIRTVEAVYEAWVQVAA